jgi:hypothetical protein
MNASPLINRSTFVGLFGIALFLGGSANAAEPVKHSPTGFVFPKTVASFEREKVIKYDKKEDNISVGYNDPRAPAAITVYVYPASAPYSAASLRTHFNDCRRQMSTQDPSPQTVLEGETKPLRSYRGFAGMYSYIDNFGGRMQQVISWLKVYQSGNYIVKFRQTYPDASADASSAAIAKFNEAFAWPK